VLEHVIRFDDLEGTIRGRPRPQIPQIDEAATCDIRHDGKRGSGGIYMVWLVPGVVLYAVVGFAAMFALCLAASSAEDRGERAKWHALEHPAVTDAEQEAAHVGS
jgi:hypothetical protein